MTMKMDDLVATYIKIRDKKSRLKTRYDEEKAKYDKVQDLIEAELLKQFGALGIDSIKTPAGTAYTSVTTSVSIQNWDAYKAFLLAQEDPFMFVERRASKEAVEQFRAANDDLPPGLNWSATKSVNFRRQ